MQLFCRGFFLPVRLGRCGKSRVHKRACSRCWRKPNQPRHFCSSSSSTPELRSRSTKNSSSQPDQEPHTPVLLKEVLQHMDVKPGQVGISAFSFYTFMQYQNVLSHLKNWLDMYMPLWSNNIKAPYADTAHSYKVLTSHTVTPVKLHLGFCSSQMIS